MESKEKVAERKVRGGDIQGVAPKKLPRESKKTPFLGVKITPENRLRQKEMFYQRFMETILSDEEHKDKTMNEKHEGALFFARLECNRELKHYKAWLKGKEDYTYHKRKYPVLRDLHDNGDVYLSDILEEE